MKKIVLGTAGHIDHGKTSLIKALTGVDCDRLKEEKLRGITIELGFTSLILPNSQRVGIVDVPGHEKFIKNMVAGVGGIDGVLMVIAADEGVMPQTREHLDICRILSIKKGLIVLTKTDLVDDEWISLVTEDIQNSVKDSFLDGAPVIPVSSSTGSGIEELRTGLESFIAEINERPAAGIPRLPIDRVFTIKGFGTVVTGTLLAGTLSVGDEVEIPPGNMKTRIRGVQVHSEQVPSVTAGLRTALNLQGIEKATIERGNVISVPDTLIPTRRADAWFDHLQNAPRPLKNRSIVRFHSGTSEIPGRVILLDREELKPGESGFVQLILDSPAVLLPHDRYVIRSYSPVSTIGGGEIIDNLPLRHKRFYQETLQGLDVLRKGDMKDRILMCCREKGFGGLDFSTLLARTGFEPAVLHTVIDQMLSKGTITAFTKKPLGITLPGILNEIEAIILDRLKIYHDTNPLKPGLVKEELREKLPGSLNQKLYAYLSEKLLKNKKIVTTKEFLSLPDHKPVLHDDQKDLKNRIVSLYTRGGTTPPTKRELIEKLQVQDREVSGMLSLLVRDATLVKLNEDILYEPRSLKELIESVVADAEKTGEITIKSFKDITGLSRKFAIPIFEYMDRTKITIRMGDKRVLRK